MIRVTVDGDTLAGMGEAELRAMRPNAERAVRLGALYLERTAKGVLREGPRTGRIYPRGSTYHQASAPGEPPAVDTGALRMSVTHTAPKWRGDTVSSEAGTHLEYGSILEFGGRTFRRDERGRFVSASDEGTGTKRRIAPRPWMRVAVEKSRAAIEKILEQLL